MTLFAKLKPGIKSVWKDTELVQKHEYDRLYEVSRVSVGQSYTSVSLVNGLGGNSVWFDFYKLPEYDIYSDPEYNHYLPRPAKENI